MEEPSLENISELREKIIASLRAQGFHLEGGSVSLPCDLSKDETRNLHRVAVSHRRERARKSLFGKESQLLFHIASGNELDPACISPRLVEVQSGSEEELLFRYASLHWNIPVSSGYGRRLRFLVIDEQNDKLIGLIGLGDPVMNLKPRDQWIGWERTERSLNLKHVVDAYVLGAVPPYSFLLCGKLVALLVASGEVRETFRAKYDGARSLITGRPHDGRLALVTTSSALGRSSIYNRLRIGDRRIYHSVGFTQGSGEFHFTNGLYNAIFEYATKHSQPTAKHKQWGVGFRNRREVLKKSLPLLGIPADWLYHGVEREVFVIPLASNSRAFLCGQDAQLQWFTHSTEDIFQYFRERWLLPRARNRADYRDFQRDSYRLWPKGC